jgi:chromosome segregation ATPase
MVDTMTAAERAVELQRQIVVLKATREQNERGLAGERPALRSATEKRAALVSELTEADAAAQAWASNEIDRLDAEIRTFDRRIESYTGAIARIDGHIARLAAELTEANEIVKQEERARAFSALQTQIRKDRRAAEDALDAARNALFVLNRTAVQGIAECGEAGRSIVTSALEEFQHQQHNPEVLLGWHRRFELWGDLRFTIQPMVKGAVKR